MCKPGEYFKINNQRGERDLGSIGRFVVMFEKLSFSPDMADEFTACGERSIAFLALMRPSARVGVDVVLQRG